MSKLNMDVLKESIHAILTEPKKKRGFLETVEVQLMLKVITNEKKYRITTHKRTNDSPDQLSFLTCQDQN